MERKSTKSHMVKIPMAKSPLTRSPMPKSPMHRSPMPKSPIPKSPIAYEKYKSKCAYGLISFFRFRHRRSKKMISDTYSGSSNRHALDDRRFKSRLDLHSDQYIHDGIDEKTVMVDPGNVNKIRRNVCTEQQMKKKTTTAKMENVQSDSERVHDLSWKIRKATKTSQRPRRLPIYGCYNVSIVGNTSPMHQNLAEKSLKSLESSERSNCRQCDELNEINLQVNLKEATEAFINQKLIDGRHISSNGASHRSKHFLDALGVLNSNKDLFVKLLQDPNSLLVKHIEDLRDSRGKEQLEKLPVKSELLENHLGTRKEGQFKENDNSQPLENIVVLKPCQQSLQQTADKTSPDSQQIHYRLQNVKQSVEPAFFSFEQMKRKLLQAIRLSRKEREVKGSRNSPKNAASDFQGLTTYSIDVNRKYQMDKVDESGPGVKDEAGTDSEKCLKSSCSSAEKHDVHAEPRMDISELKSGNMNFSRMQRAKSWHGITCDPDYDFLPTTSSRRTEETGLLSPRSRHPAYNSHQIVSKHQLPLKKNGCFSPVRQNLEAPPWVVNRKQYKTKLNISSCSVDVSETVETSNSQNSEELSPTGSTSESEFPCNSDVNQSIKTVDTEESGSLASSRTDSSLENQTSISSLDDYSSSPSNHQSLKEFDVIKDNAEQPSPISVLDQFYTEDVNSPSNTKSLPMRQLQIDTEEGWLAAHDSPLDLKIKSSHSMEECGAVLNYISNVLQASNFTWDELSWRCCFSDQLLDPTLFEEINAQCCGDHKLLFDYVNEVVLDAYWCYIRCSPWLSFMKPRILPDISPTENIVHEMMKYVDRNLLLAKPLETLENIVETDLTKSGKWTDIRVDAEDAVSEMIDSLLEELTIEIALQEPI